MKDIVEVRGRSPRFQLIKSEIDQLAPDGDYHFIANCEDQPIHYMVTRAELERDFATPMRTMSYRQRGLYRRSVWPLAEKYRTESTKSVASSSLRG